MLKNRIVSSIYYRNFSVDLVQKQILSLNKNRHTLSDNLFHDRQSKFQAVIFDKDGTLICFHSMWTSWVTSLVKNINKELDKDISKAIYTILGVCSKTFKAQPGLFAEGTKDQIINALQKVIMTECSVSQQQSIDIIEKHFQSNATNENSLKEIHDIRKLFKIIKQHGMKIGICTSDTREGTLSALISLNAQNFVDCICCGDDPNTKPKPDPFNSTIFSKHFNLPVSDMVMVGDTRSDMEFGKNSGMGGMIGVLSGIGDKEILTNSGATEIIQSVEDILPILMPSCPIRLSKNSESISSQKWKLIIMDKDGTLTDLYLKYKKWALLLGERLKLSTSSEIMELFYNIIGFGNIETFETGSILGESAILKMKDIIKYLLILQGYSLEETERKLTKIWVDTSVFSDDELPHFKETLVELKSRGLKLALNSNDVRSSINNFLQRNNIDDLFDSVVSAEDSSPNFKPLPHSILKICSDLQVSPSETLLIGDSQTDMLCGISAKVGASVGVLSGLGKPQNLMGLCQLLIPNINYLPKLIHCRQFHTSNPKCKWKTLFNPPKKIFDYVIVGAGSAGCVLANRLSEDNNHSVNLLEAGPSDKTWTINMPAALIHNLFHDKYNWFYETKPQQHMNNRRMYIPRGRVIGGSSSLNAMVYVRGHPYDYNRWEKEGASGWSYASCLPYFKKAQSHELGEDLYRGGKGLLNVSRSKLNNILHPTWIEAGKQAGYGFTDDMNGFKQEGFGILDQTIYKGERWSASRAYLRPVMNKSNLTVTTQVLVTKILFDGRKAVGVEIVNKHGELEKVMVNREVILSGGAINSPQIMMLSGVGNADELKKHSIDIIHHLPGVGKNLQDHLEVYCQYKCKKPITLYSAQWQFPHNMIRIGIEWFLFKTGLATSSHLESGAFIRSDPSVDHPDIQQHFLPGVINDHGRKPSICHAFQVFTKAISSNKVFKAHVGTMRSQSKGSITLQSNDPRTYPIIDPNYHSHELDFPLFRKCVRLTREIFAQSVFDEFRGDELLPGSHVISDSQIDEFVRNKGDTAYHQSSTCKMGSQTDKDAVVDSQCKVLGLENLRIVDASIMPSIVSGNLNAPVMMMAEKAADMILGKPALPRAENVPIWKPKYPHRQREFDPH